MVSKTIEAKAEVVEIKKDGKYILLFEDVPDSEARRLIEKLQEWIHSTDHPVMALWGKNIQLIDVNELKEIRTNGKT